MQTPAISAKSLFSEAQQPRKYRNKSNLTDTMPLLNSPCPHYYTSYPSKPGETSRCLSGAKLGLWYYKQSFFGRVPVGTGQSSASQFSEIRCVGQGVSVYRGLLR